MLKSVSETAHLARRVLEQDSHRGRNLGQRSIDRRANAHDSFVFAVSHVGARMHHHVREAKEICASHLLHERFKRPFVEEGGPERQD
jgi:hypothetical protein